MTASQSPPVIAVLGLGEAGSAFAADLVSAGAVVQGFDPKVPAPPGVTERGSDADAVRGAGLIIALTSAHEAMETLELARPGIARGAAYADLNTASAGVKAALAQTAARAGAGFADVALMAPVPGRGLRTPMLACGPAAGTLARVLGALGATVTTLPGPPGTAAARKLVRSVFYKGLAAAVTEALRAGRAAGCEDWLRANIGEELTNASAATVDRLERGSVQHARRRVEEMSAAAELLDELGVPSRVARASQHWLEQLLAETAGTERQDSRGPRA